jgi:hypothetical protein
MHVPELYGNSDSLTVFSLRFLKFPLHQRTITEVDINNAPDIVSQDPEDRTATITVTADDGITQKIYTVLFKFVSINATLDTLYTICRLNPEFDPEVLLYEVCIPTGVTDATPGIVFETADVGTYSIEITSLSGQQMYSAKMKGTTHQLDLSTFQKGIYFIIIRSKDFVTTRKIVKL